MGRSGSSTRSQTRPVFRVEHPPLSDDALAVLTGNLERFIQRYHDRDHGNAGYELERCPLGRCRQLQEAHATIVGALERVRAREQELSGQLADCGLELPPPHQPNRETLSRDAAAVFPLFEEADQQLFIRGHGRDMILRGALSGLEYEYVRAADVNVRAVGALANAY